MQLSSILGLLWIFLDKASSHYLFLNRTKTPISPIATINLAFNATNLPSEIHKILV